MDYNEYKNEYQKIILKESFKRGISVKQRLMETIRSSDKQEMLEIFLQTNDFDGQIKYDELMLQDLGDDDEFKELIEKDVEATKELKETAEDRLKNLKEQEKDNDKEDKDKEQDDEKLQESEDDEHDEHSGKDHDSEQNSSLVNNDVKKYQDTQIITPISTNKFPVYGSQEYYVDNIKYKVNIMINSMQKIKANIDRCPSPMMLMYMDGEREVFDSVQGLAITIQNMPGCDEELKMLTEKQIKAAQDVKDTVDKYIEQYRERNEREEKGLKDKDEEKTSLKEMEDELQQQEGKDEDKREKNEYKQDGEGPEQETEELEQDDDNNTHRKSWELSPKQKEEVQISTRQVAQEHMERQANPQPVQEQPTIEVSSGFDR